MLENRPNDALVLLVNSAQRVGFFNIGLDQVLEIYRVTGRVGVLKYTIRCFRIPFYFWAFLGIPVYFWVYTGYISSPSGGSEPDIEAFFFHLLRVFLKGAANHNSRLSWCYT